MIHRNTNIDVWNETKELRVAIEWKEGVNEIDDGDSGSDDNSDSDCNVGERVVFYATLGDKKFSAYRTDGGGDDNRCNLNNSDIISIPKN